MSNRIGHINKYLVYDILGIAVYGLVLYFGFTWLAGFSLLYASLWNFALIVLAVAFDAYANKIVQSDETIKLMKEKYNAEKVDHMIRGGFVSFKSLIYLFYLFLLVASKTIDINPAIASENFVHFIHTNDYSIVFLLAFDTFINQFAKDRESVKIISEKLKASSTEDDASKG